MSDDALVLLAIGGGAVAAAALLSRPRSNPTPSITMNLPTPTTIAPLAPTSSAASLSNPVPTASATTPAPTSSTSTAAPIAPATPDTVVSAPESAWVYPVPNLADRVATISDGFGSKRDKNGKTHVHLGADVMFKRRDARDLIAVYPAKTPNGAKWFFMPEGVPALAASAGTVRLAEWTAVGFTVVILHPSGWASYYTHMSALAVARGARVAAGQKVGTIGFDPTDPECIKHLHFELWKGGTRGGVLDPAPYLAAWPHIAIPTWTPIPSPALVASAELRNATLAYRPVGERGERYPAWLRRIRGESGVYVIRKIGGPVVYVGQSSAGRLYETLTRHLQDWRRYKSFWSNQFSEGHDPGLTYDRASVEVAIKVTSPNDALDEEARLIRRLRPTDNIIGQLEEAPF